jgi:hypothetical protein
MSPAIPPPTITTWCVSSLLSFMMVRGDDIRPAMHCEQSKSVLGGREHKKNCCRCLQGTKWHFPREISKCLRTPLWGWAGIWWPSSPVAVATNLATCQSEVPAVCAPSPRIHAPCPVQPVLSSHQHQDKQQYLRQNTLYNVACCKEFHQQKTAQSLSALLQVSFLVG